MVVLIFQFFILAIWGIIVYNSSVEKRRKDTVFFAGAFLSMWYIHSMVAPDSLFDLPVYRDVFNSLGVTEWRKIPNHWAHVDMELGYLYINKFVYYITTSFTGFLCFWGGIMVFLYVWTIKKYSPYMVFSVLLYLLIPYNQSLFVIRQHMAMAICFSTIPLIIERRLIPFLLVIASTIFFCHRSSFIFIPVYFLYSLKGKKLIIVLTTLLVSCYFLWHIILSYSYLFNYEAFTSELEGANVTTFLQSLLLLGLYIWALKKNCTDEGLSKLLFIILLIGVFINAVSMGIDIGRITMYYNVFEILSVPLSLKYIKEKHMRYLIAGAILVLFFIQMIYGGNRIFYEDMYLQSLL